MYDIGDIVPLGLTVTDADGNPANGGAVTLTIGLPDGTTATPAPSNPQTGQYTVDYPATQEGLHTVSWVVTGANATAYRDVFNVREITEQVLSLAEAKRQLRLTTSSQDPTFAAAMADRDNDLRLFIAAAGKAVEDHTHTALVRRTITEKVRVERGKLWLTKTPVLSVVSVAAVNGSTTWNTANLDVREDLGLVTAQTGPGVYGYVRVSYVCGKRVIPANELLACRIITEHLWQTMRPFTSSVAGLAPGALEDSLDTRAGGLTGFAIPNRALELLGAPGPLVA